MECEESGLERIRREREQKAHRYREQGQLPYANDFRPTVTCAKLNALYENRSREELAACQDIFHVAGRIMAMRVMGKASFLRIQDGSGGIQIFLQQNRLGEEGYRVLKLLDVGDIVGVIGTPMRTKTDELTVCASSLRILTKSLQPLPEKWHGFTNIEQRYRKRYVDLIVNRDARDIFKNRSRIIGSIRSFLDDRDFIEVETPILMDVAGGAAAKPFLTHHNALSEDLSLRIATELHLKRLVVGGFERVYEIGRLFRNEGISTRHNPEFTSIEFYQAYANYEDLMDLTEEMMRHLVREIHGCAELVYQGNRIDFSKPFERTTIAYAVARHLGFDESASQELNEIASIKQALEIARAKTVSEEEPLRICLEELTDEEARLLIPGMSASGTDSQRLSELALEAMKSIGDSFYLLLGKSLDDAFSNNLRRRRRVALHLIYAVFENEVENSLIQPTFVTDFSVSVSPLARMRDDDSAVVDRFEFFAGGMEIANAFSELTDPIDQRERFSMQSRRRARGDEEATELDEDFIQALEVGMPPTAGEGIGIDRLIMLLQDCHSIRDVILFPKMRSK